MRRTILFTVALAAYGGTAPKVLALGGDHPAGKIAPDYKKTGPRA